MDRDKIDLESGKIGPLFRTLFFPTLIGMVFMSLQTVIDGIFVGRGVGADGIAAVNIVAPMWMVVTGLGLMFGIGASVIGGVHLAEKNVKAARIILTQSFGVGCVITTLLSLLCVLFPTAVISVLGCSKPLESYALDYLLWLLPGMTFLFWQCNGMMLIRLDGSPHYAMLMQVTSAVVNIVLDWIFIFPLGMGVKGAAIATSIACGVGGLMSLVYFMAFSSSLKFYRLKASRTSLLLTLRNLWNMSKIGSATFLTEIAMSITILTGNYQFMAILHEDGVAAYAVVCYLFPVIFSVNNAVAQAAQPIISYNYGARHEGRVSQTLRISLLTAITCGLCVMLTLIIGDEKIVLMFLHTEEEAYRIAMDGLPWFSACSVFFAINVAFIGYYQSVTSAGRAMSYTLLRGVLFPTTAFVLLPTVMGITGLWLAIPSAELATSLIILASKLCPNNPRNGLLRV